MTARRLISILLLVAVAANGFQLKRKVRDRAPTTRGLEGSFPLRASSVDRSAEEEEKLASMVKMIMNAVDEGREEELIEAGLKVTKRTAKEVMDSNMSNEEIVNKVLGPMTDAEEVEIMRQLHLTHKKIQEGDDRGFDDTVAGIDPGLLAELKEEALGVVDNLQKDGRSVIAKEMGILDDEKGSARVPAWSSDEVRNDGFLSPIDDEEIPREYSFIANDNMTEAKKNAEGICREREWVENKKTVEEDAEEEEQESRGDNDGREGMVPARIIAMAAAEELSSGLSKDEEASAQETFSTLLKATMDAQVEVGEMGVMDEEMKKATIDAVAGGDLAALDVKSLLGDSLSMLTDSLGIDIAAELADPKAQMDMKVILEGGMSELAANMKELDAQNEALYQQLGTLEQELRAETESFNERKSGELEELLVQQSSFQQDLDVSRVKVEASAAQLEGLMADLEDRADVLTALALFPVKRVDKKAAFVMGLGIVFKSLYNLSELVATRSADPSDWLNIVTQVGLIFVFFSHYGLVKAMSNSPQDFSLPPPPE